MFVKDLRKDFYEKLQNKRILVFVAFDVDALCACRILQYLFQCDQVLYSIVPVCGIQELERAYAENAEGIQHVVLINCGANIDIVELLQPDENVVFYICDSHRPVDVHNVYNSVQVKLVMKEEELAGVIPQFEDIFREDESDAEDSGNNSDDSEGNAGRRKQFNEASLDRRRERRLWEEGRTKILFTYAQFASYGTSAALIMFELAWKMSKDTNDLLWLSIVGVTDQLIHYKTTRDKYFDDVMALQSHVSRHNHKGDDNESLISIDCLRISFDEELALTLYRHWSLFESIIHSISMACRFKVWTMKGQKRLHEFLAEMGLPLTQCKQKFSAMDSTLKGNIKSMIQEHMTKYSLQTQDVVVPSFCAQYGYRTRLCASDMAHACAAALEATDNGKGLTDSFLGALDLLQRGSGSVDNCIELAKTQLKAIIQQVQTSLDMHQVISAGPFLYAFIQEGTAEGKFFSKPQCLTRLARFTLEAYCSVARNKKAQGLPLVLGAPLSTEQGTILVIGIPPLDMDNERKNFFGKAFEQAAVSTSSRSLHDHFETNIIELKSEDRSKFFDALISLLQ